MQTNMCRTKWYAAGLHFECIQCGRCCAGPGEGYIWVTRPEIELIADFLGITVQQLHKDYLRRVGLHTTIIERPVSKDCVFLKKEGRTSKCKIYPVRPSQCRMWPFWPENLAKADAWNSAAQKCPGINRGRLYSYEQIQRLKNRRKWWQDCK
jgi:hypothetical protein